MVYPRLNYSKQYLNVRLYTICSRFSNLSNLYPLIDLTENLTIEKPINPIRTGLFL